jgi:hypothetical protein
MAWMVINLFVFILFGEDRLAFESTLVLLYTLVHSCTLLYIHPLPQVAATTNPPL